MPLFQTLTLRPRAVGIACAVGAVLLGLGYMAFAGAPVDYLVVNTGALVIGLGLLALVGRGMPHVGLRPGAATLAMATGLLATALFGQPIEGAARWVQLGPLSVQPSLILLPVMIVEFARSRDALSAGGMIVAAAALAIQPDRAMAAMLAAGLAVLAVMRPDRRVIPAFAAALVGFGVTLIRADRLPAVPYVDQILYSAFDVHALAGLAVVGGSLLLLVPAILGRLGDVDHRETYWVFGSAWLAAILAAALGNYPTPVVGYSGAAVLGYVLSLAILPTIARSRAAAEAAVPDRADKSGPSGRDSLRWIGALRVLSARADGGDRT